MNKIKRNACIIGTLFIAFIIFIMRFIMYQHSYLETQDSGLALYNAYFYMTCLIVTALTISIIFAVIKSNSSYPLT